MQDRQDKSPLSSAPGQEAEEKKKFRWGSVWASVLILGGFGALNDAKTGGPLAAIVMWIFGYLCLPKTVDQMEERNPTFKRWIPYVASMVAISLVIPNSNPDHARVQRASQVESPKSSSVESPSSEESEMVLSAPQIYREFRDNTLAAEKKYKGFFKKVVVEGVVENVGKNIEGDTYLALSVGEYEINSVQCFFGFLAKRKLSGLSPGQVARVRCKVQGLHALGNLILKRCKVLE